MNIDGKKVYDIAIKMTMRELLAYEGSTHRVTATILRNWSQDKIKRFALHLQEECERESEPEPAATGKEQRWT